MTVAPAYAGYCISLISRSTTSMQVFVKSSHGLRRGMQQTQSKARLHAESEPTCTAIYKVPSRLACSATRSEMHMHADSVRADQPLNDA